MIYTVTLNPALDKTVQVPGLTIDEVNRVDAMRADPGGKGINVTKVIAKLGGESRALCLLGGTTGTRIAAMLQGQDIDVWAFNVEGETRTNLKVVDPAGHTNTDINEPGPIVGQEALSNMLNVLTDVIGEGDIVVLSGSLPKGAPSDTYATWVRACREAGAKVYLDADGDALIDGIEAAPSLIKPNDIELGRLVGHELEDDASIVAAARDLIAKGVERVVVSMGGAGALFVTADEVWRAHSPKVEVGSTVGAGDSVVAALAYAEETGLDQHDTMTLAMATGSANVMQSGTQAADRGLVDSLIDKVTIDRI